MTIEPGRLKDLFNAAAEIADPDARRAMLDRECGSSQELRQRLDELLRAHDQPAAVVDAPLVAPISAALASTEQVGQVLAGRYKLLEEIGAGGMGTVWVAQQIEPVRRMVAVKLIKAGMDTRSVLSRFEAERQALALMDHNLIAKVFDGGMTDTGRPFFVMEYVKGVPITSYCDDCRLSIADRLKLFIPVCQAVQHAHQKGIIHRDLKPSNILICMYEGQPVPKIIDFGLAKAMHQPLSSPSVYTAQGQMLGTPIYMSPEQAGINLDIDTRSDVYSLGVVLYELLTGTTPLDQQRFRDAAWQEMLRLIKEQDPPTPSSRLSGSDSLPSVAAQRHVEPVQLTRLVKGELDWIVMKCLEKDRSRRYETATGLSNDVQRFLADELVEAGPPSAAYRWRKFLSRNRGRVIATGLVFLALVAGMIGTALALIEARTQRDAAIVARDEQSKQRSRAEAAEAVAIEKERIATELAESERRANHQARQNLQMAIAAVDQFCTSVSEDPRLQQHDLRQLREQLLRTALQYSLQFVSQRQDDPEAQLELAAAYERLGRLTSEIDTISKAIEYFQKAIDLCRRYLAAQPGHFQATMQRARCQIALTYAWRKGGRNADSLVPLQEAIELLSKLPGDVPERNEVSCQMAMATFQLGQTQNLLGEHRAAEETLKKAVSIYESMPASEQLSTEHSLALATTCSAIGLLLRNYDIQRWEEARDWFRRSTGLSDALRVRDPKKLAPRLRLAEDLRNLANINTMQRQFRDAERDFLQAIDLQEAIIQEHGTVLQFHFALAQIYEMLGTLYDVEGDLPKATSAGQKVITILERLAAQDADNLDYPSLLSRQQARLGTILRREGDFHGSLEWLDQSVPQLERINAQHPGDEYIRVQLSVASSERAQTLVELDRAGDAIADWDRALEFGDKLLRPWREMQRALALAKSGDHVAAAAEARRINDSWQPDSRGNQQFLVGAARVLAVAAEKVSQDTALPEAEREQTERDYDNEVLQILRKLLLAPNNETLKLDWLGEFPRYHDQEEFQTVLRDLAERARINRESAPDR